MGGEDGGWIATRDDDYGYVEITMMKIRAKGTGGKGSDRLLRY